MSLFAMPAPCGKEPGADRRRKLLFRGVLLLGIMVFIFFMSARNGEESTRISEGFLATALGQWLVKTLPAVLTIRKYAHIFEFFCLGLAAHLFFDALPCGKLRLLWAWLFCLLYAASDEFHQLFVPGRAGRVTDVCIDAMGFTAGVLLCCSVLLLLKKKKPD